MRLIASSKNFLASSIDILTRLGPSTLGKKEGEDLLNHLVAGHWLFTT